MPVLAQSSRWGRAPAIEDAPQPLRAGQLVIGAVGAVGDGDPEPVAQIRRHLLGDGDVPATDEERGNGGDVGVEVGLDAALHTPHVGLGGGEVLIGREEQGDVDRNAGEDRILDRRKPRLGTGDLDEEVVALGPRVQLRRLLDRRRGVIGEQRRDLQRDETVNAVGALVHGGEEVGGGAQVGDRELEEEILGRARRGAVTGDLLIVGVAGGDRLVEDRRVGGETCNRELLDVALQGAVARTSCG